MALGKHHFAAIVDFRGPRTKERPGGLGNRLERSSRALGVDALVARPEPTLEGDRVIAGDGLGPEVRTTEVRRIGRFYQDGGGASVAVASEDRIPGLETTAGQQHGSGIVDCRIATEGTERSARPRVGVINGLKLAAAPEEDSLRAILRSPKDHFIKVVDLLRPGEVEMDSGRNLRQGAAVADEDPVSPI